MVLVDIAVGSRYPANRQAIRNRVTQVFQQNGVQDAEVSVSVVGSRRMVFLNETLMKHEGVTDVLSFPQSDPEQPDKNFSSKPVGGPETPTHYGDIVVCFPEAVKEARKKGRMVDDQICNLVEHGLMHLLGYHHE